MSLIERLRPTAAQIERLALRETDPALYRDFEPITRGPLAAVAILGFIAVTAAVITPFRLAAHLLGGERD